MSARVYLGKGRENNYVPAWDHRRYHVQDYFDGLDAVWGAEDRMFRFFLLTVIQVAIGGHQPFMTIGRVPMDEGIGGRETLDLRSLLLVSGGNAWGDIKSVKKFFEGMRDQNSDRIFPVKLTDVGPITEYE